MKIDAEKLTILVRGEARKLDRGAFPTLAEAKAACDAALRAQGYVLDGETP